MLAPHMRSTTQTASTTADLDAPSLSLNRAISWLQCNWRVLEEALDERHPLLERVKFLALFTKNLDEFFMIRVSGLLRQVTEGVLKVPPDGLRPSEQLTAIRHTVMTHLARYAECWHHDVLPQLRAAGIHILHYRELRPKQRAFVAQYFAREIFPILTPLALDPTHPFPYISHLSLNLAVVVNDPLRGECFARVKVEDVCPRLIRIPDEDHVEQDDETGLSEIVDRDSRRVSGGRYLHRSPFGICSLGLQWYLRIMSAHADPVGMKEGVRPIQVHQRVNWVVLTRGCGRAAVTVGGTSTVSLCHTATSYPCSAPKEPKRQETMALWASRSRPCRGTDRFRCVRLGDVIEK